MYTRHNKDREGLRTGINRNPTPSPLARHVEMNSTQRCICSTLTIIRDTVQRRYHVKSLISRTVRRKLYRDNKVTTRAAY